MLDYVSFYNEVDVGFRLENFNLLKELKPFVPVASYNQESVSDRA